MKMSLAANLFSSPFQFWLLLKHPQSLHTLLCMIKHVSVKETQEKSELLLCSRQGANHLLEPCKLSK